MGDPLAPGPPTAALTAMWRSVYRKAADAAEARLQALLAQHVGERHGRRAVAVVLDGGGAALAAGAKTDLELPWAYRLEGWALYAPAVGTLQLDLLAGAGLATFPGDLATICGPDAALRPQLSGAQKARSDDLTGWTATALARGTILRVAVVTATVPAATLTLHLRAL